MIERLTRLIPDKLSRPATRYAVPIAVVAVLLLAGAVVATASLVSPGALGITAARLSETNALPDAFLSTDLAAKDTDKDGVSDSLENYIYGTDPNNWDTSGLGIPDGWLVQFGHDPLSPLLKDRRGVGPSLATLPPAYRGAYPVEYTPLLKDYYAYGKPAGYAPGVDAPWWRNAPHADPSRVDQTGSGVPTGWMLFYGLVVTDNQVDKVAPTSAGNLTIRDAYLHNTNPLAKDSDKDGVDDWTEIHVTGTDPGRFSTSGTGIADGWLLHYGLNAFDRDVASQDPDRDGLTNREEFVVSYDAFRTEIEQDGIALLYAKGLNPLEWDTAGSGIPDGWYVKYGLSPFDADADRVVGTASEWPESRDDAPEGYAKKPDLVMTVRDAYEYGRPADWNETFDGVWWGGTNPDTGDTDEDGIPDAVEIRGWYAVATYDVGPDAKPRVYNASSNPLEADSDGDGLSDVEEYRGRAKCGEDTRTFPPTDPRNRDTAFSGLTDREKVCGIIRGAQTYDLNADGQLRLDPTKTDSAGDFLRDGAALAFWHTRFIELTANPRYPYEGSEYRTVTDWTSKAPRFAGLSPADVLAQFRPDGDIDNDGVPNLIDADPSGGLYVDFLNDPTKARTTVFFLGGPQIDPTLYRFTEFSSDVPHSTSDPANFDTDGDGLPDSWETRYGVFGAGAIGWNLDPSKADSDGDGVNDGDANNDGDSVIWYSYTRRGTGFESKSNEFVFTNRLEFLADTDPNLASSTNDGITDGWKAFWGSRVSPDTYPNLIGSREPRVGDLALEQATQIEAAMAASPIQPLAKLAGPEAQVTGMKTTGYARYVNVTSCTNVAAELTPQRGEREVLASPPICFAGNDVDSRAIKVARIDGVFELSFRKEAELRTNPFMPDTDGDGVPDAYEAYWLRKTSGGTNHPDPIVPDSHRDLDNDGTGDGLTLRDECASNDGGVRCGHASFELLGVRYGIGLDPHRADTDRDGLKDGEEYNAGLNPLDPRDVEDFANNNKDSDGDGVRDFDEIVGWGKLEFGIVVRTDAQDPDSDGDGLLDGPTLTLDPTKPEQKARIDDWLARGIAHRNRTDGRVDFLGERTYGQPFGFNPKTADSSGTGVPDGWLAYYNENPKEKPVDVAAYTLNRPTWWDEAAHGVWWWGRAPAATSTETDLDADGLHDTNGEDPFPALRLNHILDGTTRLTEASRIHAWVTAAPTAAEERVRAQRLGDGAGDPQGARAANALKRDANGVLTKDDRARVAILDLETPAQVTKGVPFNVTGRVVLDERRADGSLLEGSENDRIGLANRTVLVSLFRADAGTLVGAGFTGPDGRFNLTANLAGSLAVDIPHEGMTLLGQTAGTVTATLDPTLIGTGAKTAGQPNRLFAWVTNTSALVDAESPTRGTHKAMLADQTGNVAPRDTTATGWAWSGPKDILVYSATTFTGTLPKSATNGDPLVGDIRLVDAAGAPIANKRVQVTWKGTTSHPTLPPLSTDTNGLINITTLGLRVDVARADDYALEARYKSDDPYLLDGHSDLRVTIQDPTRLELRLDRTAATVGDELRVTGEIYRTSVTLGDGTVTPREGIPGAAVVLRIGGVDHEATADAAGRFSEVVKVPGTLSAGEQSLQAIYAGTKTIKGADASAPLSVKRTADIVGLNKLEGPRSIDITLVGRLIDNTGAGFAGPIRVLKDGAPLAEAEADDTGAFSVGIPLRQLPLGPQTIRVAFAGDATHAPASNFTQARVTSTTKLVFETAPGTLTRGADAPLVARLVDDAGAPVTAQAVQLFYRGDSLGHQVTDAEGRVRATLTTNRTELPGPVDIGLEYRPHVSSPLQPASASHTLQLRAGTHILMGDHDVVRGLVAFSGRLVDDEERPLAARTVSIRLGETLIGSPITSRNGTFTLEHALPRDHALGPIALSASYAGDERLANATTDARWRIVSPLTLTLDEAGPFVRGEKANLVGKLVDDNGAPADITLNVTLDDAALAGPRTTDGRLKAALAIPAETTRGAHKLAVKWAGDDRYPAFNRELDIIVKIRPQVEIDLPKVAIRGFSVGGDVSLKDDEGNPLRNTTFVYTLGQGGTTLIASTNADGYARLASVAPIAGGDTFFALTVRGGDDVVPAEYRTESVTVVGPSTPMGYASLVLAVIIAIAIIAVIVVAVILRRRQVSEVRDIIEEAIQELIAGNEYAGTIFLAYKRLVAHVARHGFVEQDADTPRQVAGGIRRAVPVGEKPLAALIRLFEEARYSDHAIGSNQRDQAIENLARVRNELDAVLGRKEASA